MQKKQTQKDARWKQTAWAVGAWVVACTIASLFGMVFVNLEIRSERSGSQNMELWTPWSAGPLNAGASKQSG